MIWHFVVLNETPRTKPLGVVVHKVGDAPVWASTSKQGEKICKLLFERPTVWANIPAGDGEYNRVKKTYSDPDYLEYASVKVNLPVYVEVRGNWETDITNAEEVVAYLLEKYVESEAEE